LTKAKTKLLSFLYIFTLAWGVTTFWIAPHPPLTDLPQHAGQIALLNDLLFGQSRWSEQFSINLLTPYLSTYAISVILSQVMSIATTFKLLLSIGYLAFVYMCIQLRKHFKVDARLDWLFVLPFFGFACKYGFLSFVLSAPIGLWFILVADKYAENTTKSYAIQLTSIGLLLLISHGLMFLFAFGVGFALLFLRALKIKYLISKTMPYIIILLAFSVIFLVNIQLNKSLGLTEYSIEGSQNGLKNLELIRIPQAFFYLLAGSKISIFPLIHIPVIFILLIAPWIFGLRINFRNIPACTFFIIIIAIFAFVPGYIFGTYFVYQRFSLFIIPSYALLFTLQSSHFKAHTLYAELIQKTMLMILIGACWIVLAFNTLSAVNFKKEAAEFDQLIGSLQPGHKALSLILDPISKADNNSIAYMHYPLWYQAEKNGLVYDNFAIYAPMPVRFKPGQVHLGYDRSDPASFDWIKHKGYMYKYFFVRTRINGAIPINWFKNAPCSPQVIAHKGQWLIYESQSCSN
jgi:hypothetical protein